MSLIEQYLIDAGYGLSFLAGCLVAGVVLDRLLRRLVDRHVRRALDTPVDLALERCVRRHPSNVRVINPRRPA